MAMKHRKLFPTTTNQTLDCPDICDPSCPYGCFPYPQFYFIPPPPPPPPPSTTSGHHLSPDVVIIIITLIVTFFVLLCYYAIFVKTRSRRHRFTPPPATGEFLDENRGPTIDNPIWYITTIGLQESVINSITAVKYSKAGGLVDGTDCSVCLNEFREEETLRLLPKCSHAFHIQCIDTWLRSHTNCPMCRCGILSNSESNSHCGILSNTLSTSLSDSIHNNNPNDSSSNQATQTEMSNSHCRILSNTLSTSPNDLGSNQAAQMERSNSHCSILSNTFSTSPNDLGSNQATQMEMSNSRCGILSNSLSTTLSDSIYNNNPNDLGSNQPTQMEIPDHDGELEANQTGDPIKILQNDDETKEGEFWVVDIYADNDTGNGIQIQPMKRSFSIDSSVNINLTVESEGSSINSRIFRVMSGSSISKSLHKTPVSMKRSCSYSGRSNLSRHYRNHKAMIRL